VTENGRIEHASLTDVGLKRSHNQDSFAVLLASDEDHWRKQGHVFLVADGMGAHAVGELASELAASIIPLTYHKYTEGSAAEALTKAFTEANASIHARGQQNREFQGMGTTGTMLVLRPEGAWVGHVGDSRVYRLRDGKIEQLSFDHSLLWEMAKRLKVKPENLQGVPSNVIIRSLGPDADVQPDVEGPHPLRDGDAFLLCSDGLSGQVSDREIGVIANLLPADEACRFLIDLANLRGGPDNITVVIARVRGLASPVAAVPAAERRRWYSFIPWPLMTLVVGVAFAIQAVATSADQARSGLWFFLLASVCILIGLGGLALHAFRERLQPERDKKSTTPRVYRAESATPERSMLDRMKNAEGALTQLLREREWETDWETHETHQQRGDAFLAQGDLASAFREHCLALRPLMEVLQRRRQKGEGFQTFWEKE
jgi:protein phosphatase